MKLENILIIFAIILLATAALGLAANSMIFFCLPMALCGVIWLIDMKYRSK
jgi:hypothetical protein